MDLDMGPLNVFIGPNASGKSNFIQAISLLAAAPRNILVPFRESGTTEDWIWKGKTHLGRGSVLLARFDYPGLLGESLWYKLVFVAQDFRPKILEERLYSSLNPDMDGALLMVRREDEFKVRGTRKGMVAPLEREEKLDSNWEKVDARQSVLSQVRDASNYPELTHVGDLLGKISFFRGWPMGRDNALRRPQAVNLPDDFLLEDGSNLGLILNDLQNRLATKRLILEKLRVLYEGIEDVTTKVQGGTIQIFFHQEGLDNPIPAARLSDGTLHYLCLLTVLLHPDPPPLICIEEPELGLHPDVIRTVGKLLIDASQRTQLIVTTHSDFLVSALSETPEAVVVCERDDRGTQLRRLDPERLKDWLDRYTLGELWSMGEIGGNRW